MTTNRTQLLAEAVVSAYINKISPQRAPTRPSAHCRTDDSGDVRVGHGVRDSSGRVARTGGLGGFDDGR